MDARVWSWTVAAVAANADHAGIILVSPGFRGDEVNALADGIENIVDRYPAGLGVVVYLSRIAR